jgi:glycyl-tRNA synthetase beta subunit
VAATEKLGNMADRLYRVSFIAKPIAVHAKDATQAIERALDYARQPGTNRIVVEEGKEGPKNAVVKPIHTA